MTRWTVALIALVAAGPAFAQPPADRFELGQRLRGFEQALEKQTDAGQRAAVTKALKPLTQTFFAGRLGEAGKMLDAAHLRLATGQEPDAVALDAASVRVEPRVRFLDAAAKELGVKVTRFYKVEAAGDGKRTLRLTLCDADARVLGKAQTFDLASGAADVALALADLAEGDHTLKHEVVAGDTVVFARAQTVSVAKDLKGRLGKVQAAVKGFDDTRTTDRASLAKLARLLTDLEEGKTLETNYPAARLLKEVEGGLAALAAGKPVYGGRKPGQFWLQVATGKGTRAVRLQAPDAVTKGEPLPLVIALHGASGSENLFFDGYGAGLAAKLCAERGWLLVAPQVDFLGGPTEGLVDAVAELYPVDKSRVFVVGHSMGAGKAVAAVAAAPADFAAVAALGGGGGVRASEGLKKVPFFVGVGAEDFAYGGAKGLKDALEKAGVARVGWKAYPDVEHLTVVQVALPEVFRFFDDAAKR